MSKKTATRYAKALLEVGQESASHERFGKELRDALAIFKGAPELYKVLLNPMHKVEERLSLMGKVSESAKFSAPVARFLNILVSSRNIRQLEDIVAAYAKLEDAASGRIRAVVESPVELTADALDRIKEKISASTGKQTAVAFRTNPALIGGLVIRIENTVLDGSLKTQLERMKEKIIQGVA